MANEESGCGSVGELLERMRAGDREAAAEFMSRFGARIRRRIRGKLQPSLRRLVDTDEVLSTLGRRLDEYVREGRLRALGEEELWSLVFRIADHTLIDMRRDLTRLNAATSRSGPLADLMAARGSGSPGERVDLERVYAALPNGEDRQILSLWLTETPYDVMAQLVGASPECLRKRCERIREHLRRSFDAGAA